MLEKLTKKTVQALNSLATLVGSTHPASVREWDIDTAGLSPTMPQIPPLVNEISLHCKGGRPALYAFEILSPKLEMADFLKVYGSAKANGRRYFAQVNDLSRTLYVGSSRSLARRIREHLGFGFPRTYAMHLVYWAPKLGLQLRLHAAFYPLGSSPKALQALEDCLWENLKPMLGRQGQR